MCEGTTACDIVCPVCGEIETTWMTKVEELGVEEGYFEIPRT